MDAILNFVQNSLLKTNYGKCMYITNTKLRKYNRKWFRIIIDEAHKIGSKIKLSESIIAL